MTTTETFRFMHRQNFFARPGGAPGLARWDYRGAQWSATRPADGQPPIPVQLICPECRQKVTVRVLSREGERRQRMTMGALSLVGVVLALIGLVIAGVQIPVADDSSLSDTVRDDAAAYAIIGVLMVMGGIVVAWTFFLKRGAQVGVRGGGAGAAGFAQHIVTRVPEPTSEP